MSEYMIKWANKGGADYGYRTPGEALAAIRETCEENCYAIHELGQADASVTDERIAGGLGYRVMVWGDDDEDGTRLIASISERIN
jgi:hypothetical protein